jgi:hypothetical protein
VKTEDFSDSIDNSMLSRVDEQIDVFRMIFLKNGGQKRFNPKNIFYLLGGVTKRAINRLVSA